MCYVTYAYTYTHNTLMCSQALHAIDKGRSSLKKDFFPPDLHFREFTEYHCMNGCKYEYVGVTLKLQERPSNVTKEQWKRKKTENCFCFTK